MGATQTTTRHGTPAAPLEGRPALRCPLCGQCDHRQLEDLEAQVDRLATALENQAAIMAAVLSAAQTIAGHLETVRARGWRAWRREVPR